MNPDLWPAIWLAVKSVVAGLGLAYVVYESLREK